MVLQTTNTQNNYTAYFYPLSDAGGKIGQRGAVGKKVLLALGGVELVIPRSVVTGANHQATNAFEPIKLHSDCLAIWLVLLNKEECNLNESKDDSFN